MKLPPILHVQPKPPAQIAAEGGKLELRAAGTRPPAPPAAPGGVRFGLTTLWRYVTGLLFPGSAAAPGPARGPHYSPTHFMTGANLPWVNYGHDFGANANNPAGGIAQPKNREKLARTLDRLDAQGVKHLRWFMLCDGRSGIRYDAAGKPLGLDDKFVADVDAALAEAHKRGMTITFALADFLWFKGEKDKPGRADLLRDPAKRQALLDNVITPILKRYGQHPAIEAWDVVNEPEWAVFGYGNWNPSSAVAPSEMRAYIQEATERIHRWTSHQATVGSASTRWLDLVRGLGLDLYQAHWYDHFEAKAPLGRPVDSYKLDRPLILGEFPTKGSKRDGQALLDLAHRAGFAGAMPWGVLSTDAASDFASIEQTMGRWRQAHADIVAP